MDCTDILIATKEDGAPLMDMTGLHVQNIVETSDCTPTCLLHQEGHWKALQTTPHLVSIMSHHGHRLKSLAATVHVQGERPSFPNKGQMKHTIRDMRRLLSSCNVKICSNILALQHNFKLFMYICMYP